MSISPTQLQYLMKDLHPSRVKSRSQAGRSFSYLEGYDVKATLIRIFGFGGFSAEVIANEVVDKSQVKIGSGSNQKDGWRVSIMSTVRLTITSLGAVYTESAIATSQQPSLGDAMDMAIKSASTDALKRAATYLGTQFGLSLYNDGSKAEIVRIVVAPGQEISPDRSLSDEQKQQAAKSVGLTTPELVGDLEAHEVPIDSEDM